MKIPTFVANIIAMLIGLFIFTACQSGPQPSPEVQRENKLILEQENAEQQEEMWEDSQGDPMPTIGEPPGWERPVN